jgi:hypothetical protein
MRRSGLAIGASALFLALGHTGRSQDQKTEPAPAAAQQQDKIEISQILDSWYKVVQPVSTGSLEEKAVGFVHEVLARMPAGSQYRYQYDLTGEIDVMVTAEGKPDKLVPETHAVHIRGHLDDTYAPVYMDRHDQKGAGMLPTTVFTEENTRKIEVAYSGERKSFSVNQDEEIFYSPFLMFIALRQSGALSRPATRKAILMHPREDGSPPYADVQIEIKDMVKREVMGKKDVSVTPITYLKPPPAPTREDELLTAYIDKYGRIVEEESRRGTKRILVKTEKEALGDRPMIVSARRDPFWKEGAFGRGGAGGKPGDGGKDKPVPTKEAFPANMDEAKKLLEELTKLKQDNREAEGEKVYDRVLDLVEAMLAADLRTPLLPAQRVQIEWVQNEVERIWGGIARIMKKAQLIFARCTQMFDRDDCPGMEAGLKELKGLLTQKAIRNRPDKLSDLQRWIGQIEPLVQRCKTRIELAKKKIVLTGTTLSESWEQVPVDIRLSAFGHQVGSVLDIRFVKPIRIAIVNGKAYRVGDTVAGEGVRVEKIWAHGVQVSLRDETRDVGIRQ